MSDIEKQERCSDEENEEKNETLDIITPMPSTIGSAKVTRHNISAKSKTKRSIPISISTPTLSALTPSKSHIRRAARGLPSKLNGKDAIKLYRTVPSYRLLIRDIIKADVSIIEKRSFLLCPHRHHCVQNAFMKVLGIPILSVIHCLHPIK